MVNCLNLKHSNIFLLLKLSSSNIFHGVLPLGCKRSKYNTKSDLLLKLKNDKVRDLTKKLNEAKARMEELKKDDPEQAKAMYKSEFL